MSEPEGFIARWSRRKRAAAEDAEAISPAPGVEAESARADEADRPQSNVPAGGSVFGSNNGSPPSPRRSSSCSGFVVSAASLAGAGSVGTGAAFASAGSSAASRLRRDQRERKFSGSLIPDPSASARAAPAPPDRRDRAGA